MKQVLLFYTPIIEEIDQYSRIFHSLLERNRSNKIFIAECKKEYHLNNCISNYKGDLYKCNLCQLKRQKIFEDFKNISFLNYPNTVYEKEEIRSFEELKGLAYKGINIGIGVNSAAITILKNHKYDIRKNKQLLNNILSTSKKTIDLLEENSHLNFDEIYVFNGRVSHFNSVVEYSKSKNINYYTFEIVADRQKYLIVRNSIPHNIEVFHNELIKNWEESQQPNKKEIGELFFGEKKNLEKLKNIRQVDYTSYQKKNDLPKEIISNNNITIFGSSRNEYESIEGWNNNFLSGDDEQIIMEICNYFPDLNFIYRAHPNLKLLDNEQTRNIEKLKDIVNLKVFDSFSKISTYDLIEASEKIIVFGSTIGVEANYRGKPVICIGPSLYEKLDVAYNPKNLIELKKLLYDSFLKSRSKDDSIKYGYFELTRGVKLKKNSKNLNLQISNKSALKIFILKIYKLIKELSFQKTIIYIRSMNDERIRKKILDFLKY